MLHTYHPEMGEAEPTLTTIKQRGHLGIVKRTAVNMYAMLSHYGNHYYLNNAPELRGRGIQKLGEGYYKVTARAFDEICKQYEVKMELLLD